MISPDKIYNDFSTNKGVPVLIRTYGGQQIKGKILEAHRSYTDIDDNYIVVQMGYFIRSIKSKDIRYYWIYVD